MSDIRTVCAMSKPLRIATPCDKALRHALVNRPVVEIVTKKKRKDGSFVTRKGQVSLRDIGEATGVPFTTLNNYATEGVRGYAPDDSETESLRVLYKSHLTLEQAESLARYFNMRLTLEAE